MPFLNVDGCKIAYEVEGHGPSVLLLHGLGSCGKDWSLQVPALAERYSVITVDLRGHGESGKPPGPYSMALFAVDVARVLETIKVERAHVIGLSLGGMIAFQLAVDRPALVRSLVIVNSAPAMVPRTLRERLILQSRFWALRLVGLPRLAQRIAAVNFPEPGQATDRRALADRIAANDVEAYRAATKAIVGWSVADRIPGITCPTLVVSGDQDYTPVSLKEGYASKMPHARVAVIAHSRHVTPVDQSAAFNRVLLEFLDAQA